MPSIKPFRALKFADTEHISSLVCPPYDIVSPAEREALLQKNPHNLIQLELPVGDNKYTAAAELFARWQSEGVLALDDAPAIYIYGEDFSIGGRSYSFRGYVALVRLHEFSEGKILPHENTLSKAKEDRFNLLTETGCSFSGIYSLYDDPELALEGILAGATRVEPAVKFTDDEGVTHSLWKIADPELTAKICELCEEKQFFIADGHHRYETALRYRAANPTCENAEYIMMTLVSLQNSGLVVLPTHRIVHREAMPEIPSCFAQKPIAESEIEAELAAAYAAGKHAFVMWAAGKATLLTYLNECAVGGGLDRPAGLADANPLNSLDVQILHELLLEPTLGITPELAAAGGALSYTRSLEEAKAAGLAFILNPTRVSEIRDVALAGGKMPQKSTYFYPKIITGLLMNKVR